MTRIASVKNVQNNITLLPLCSEGEKVSTKKSCGGVIVGEDVCTTSLFLSDVYAKLETAEQNVLDGRCSPIEDAVSRIRQKHGL